VLGWFSTEHFPPWISWHAELPSFIALGILSLRGLWFSSREEREGKWFSLPATTLVFCALLIVVAIQTMTGSIVFAGDGLVRGFYLFACIAALCLGYGLGTGSEGQAEHELKNEKNYVFAATLLLGATISSVIALAQAMEVGDTSQWLVHMPGYRRPGANIGQPNQLATLILMGIASLLFIVESKKLGCVVSTMLGVLMICGLVMTESRTGLLSCWCMGIWWFMRRRVADFRLSPRIVVGVCIVLPVLYYFWPLLLEVTKSAGWHVEVFSVKPNVLPGTRLVVWPQLIEAALQHPWFGWGLGEISKAHNSVLHSYTLSEPFTYSHNIVLDMAVGIGLPLTVALMVLCGVWILSRLKRAKNLVSWYYISVILPFAIHSLLEYPFAYAYLLIPAMLALGALERSVAESASFRLPIWVPVASVITTIMVMSVTVFEYIGLEEDLRVARFEALRIGTTPEDYVRPKVFLLNQLVAINDLSRVRPKAGMSAEKIATIRDTAMRFPSIAFQNRYALTLALNDNPNEAMRQLKVIQVMYGRQIYASVRASWLLLAETQYSQLKGMALP
jgi:O-antigen ligase